MCVIIAREPGIQLPYGKMRAACITNSDGYGLSVVDRGKIETIKEFDPKGNDVDKIMKRLEDAKNQKVYLHLRFRTAGDKAVEACHPFDTLTKEDHNFHISFMHNGTLYDFEDKESPLPDSYFFNMKIVRPLLERVRSFCTTDDQMLQDEFIKTILQKYAGTTSVFTLFDQNGNELIVNKERGYDKEQGWWASNEYSFNEYHRTPSYGKGYYGGASAWEYDDEGYGGRSYTSTARTDSKGNVVGGTVTSLPKAGGTAATEKETLRSDGKQVALVVETSNLASKYVPANIVAPEKRDTFFDLTGHTLEEVCSLEREDIEQLIENYPEVTTVMIMDLLYELYLRKNNTQRVAA